MKRNSLTTAVVAGIAGVAGFAGLANAVDLNPDGLGQVLIYPYYTVNKSQDTLFSVVNTDAINGKAVKVRFLEGYNSREVLDFNLYLSPNDVWTARISQTADAAGGARALHQRPQLHGSGDSCRWRRVPHGCIRWQRSASGRRWPADDRPYARGLHRTDRDGRHRSETSTLRSASRPTFRTARRTVAYRLAASTTLSLLRVSLLRPVACSVRATSSTSARARSSRTRRCIDGFSSQIPTIPPVRISIRRCRMRSRPMRRTALRAHSCSPTVRSSPSTTPSAIDAVSAVFMDDAIYNEYIVVRARCDTDWIVTFPTKRFYVDPLYVGATAVRRSSKRSRAGRIERPSWPRASTTAKKARRSAGRLLAADLVAAELAAVRSQRHQLPDHHGRWRSVGRAGLAAASEHHPVRSGWLDASSADDLGRSASASGRRDAGRRCGDLQRSAGDGLHGLQRHQRQRAARPARQLRWSVPSPRQPFVRRCRSGVLVILNVMSKHGGGLAAPSFLSTTPNFRRSASQRTGKPIPLKAKIRAAKRSAL